MIYVVYQCLFSVSVYLWSDAGKIVNVPLKYFRNSEGFTLTVEMDVVRIVDKINGRLL